MAEKLFAFEKEKINTTIACRVYKGDGIIFEVVNWDSLSNTNCTEVEEIVDLLNEQHERIQRLKDENYELKQTVAQLLKESIETSQKKEYEKYNIQPYAIMKRKGDVE